MATLLSIKDGVRFRSFWTTTFMCSARNTHGRGGGNTQEIHIELYSIFLNHCNKNVHGQCKYRYESLINTQSYTFAIFGQFIEQNTLQQIYMETQLQIFVIIAYSYLIYILLWLSNTKNLLKVWNISAIIWHYLANLFHSKDLTSECNLAFCFHFSGTFQISFAIDLGTRFAKSNKA